ncbi:UNVERIFIED_CONTAM: Raucaffricine-O-beta-D-glucosidase [Sesamum radiatum]|uniref:Raucaffricine-O-beta-D-glucosidase n=1 Tax=Sesamum radiatum TaxID=300843 RepID=A0AAW2MHR2_SESRA
MSINATEIGKAESTWNINCSHFPPDFIFGVGTSAYQHEGGAVKGGRGPSIWDVFTLNAPGGRLSLGVNKEGIDYYNDLINTIIANDMKPFITLFHFDLPQSLQQEYDGFLSRDVVECFREFAELCFWEFGDRVKYWITLNEPWSYAHNGYVTRKFPPLGRDLTGALRSAAPTSSPPALTQNSKPKMMNYIPYRARPHDEQHNQFLKAAAAPNQFSSSGSRQRWDPPKILILLQETCCLLTQKLITHTETNLRFLEPVLTGQYPKRMRDFVPSENLAPISEREAEMLKGSIDFLGLNYYTAIYAANNPNPGADVQEGYSRDQHVKFSYTDPLGTLIGPQAGSEWLHIYPEGLYKLLIKYVNEQYKDKVPVMYITENGVDEENDYRLTAKDACADSMREDYLKRHLQKLLDAINNDK